MNSTTLKIAIVLSFCFLSGGIYAQDKDAVVYLKHSPVADGYTRAHSVNDDSQKSTDDPNTSIDILSDKSEVYSLTDGTVTNVFSIQGGGVVVMVKTGATFFVYNGLNDVILEKGAHVAKGQQIGILQKAKEANNYVLNLGIWDASKYKVSKPVCWTDEKMISYMQ